jgi:hypothetical protein
MGESLARMCEGDKRIVAHCEQTKPADETPYWLHPPFNTIQFLFPRLWRKTERLSRAAAK